MYEKIREQRLNIKQIESDYEKSNKRLLFLDFEGTLPSAYQSSAFLNKDSPPSAEIINLLKDSLLQVKALNN